MHNSAYISLCSVWLSQRIYIDLVQNGQLGYRQAAYPKSAYMVAWKCLKSLCGGGGGGGGGWVESEFSDRLWLSFSLALAKPNNK